MLNTPEFRASVASRLAAAAAQVPSLTAFVGLDGFVDEILHVVDKRYDAVRFDRIPTIAAYAQRMAAAAGRSTNIELVNVLTKLGGNGPIMANALASLGIGVTYVGSLGGRRCIRCSSPSRPAPRSTASASRDSPTPSSSRTAS